MDFSTLRMTLAIAIATLLPGTALSDDADVGKLQQSFGQELITVRIGDFAETHDITLAAYQTLVNQGIPTTLVNMPVAEQKQLRALVPGQSGWNVGVFR